MKDGQMQDSNTGIENSDVEAIQEYIQNQLKEDQIAEQLELEIEDPFTGNKK